MGNGDFIQFENTQRTFNNGVEASAKRWDRLTSEAQVNKPKPLPTAQKVETSPVAQLHTAKTDYEVKVTDIKSLRAFFEGCQELCLVGRMVCISIFENFFDPEPYNKGKLTEINISGEDTLEFTLNCDGENKKISLQLPKDAGKWIHITSNKLFV